MNRVNLGAVMMVCSFLLVAKTLDNRDSSGILRSVIGGGSEPHRKPKTRT